MARPGRDLPRIAVLPFRNRCGDAELESSTDGLTEDIITGLSHFSVYFVVAASSSFRFKGKVVDVRDVAKELGARYVIDCSLRKAAANIRVNVQLADAVTGAQLWAENFDRNLRSQEVFALQDHLTDQIAATVADMHGVLARSMGALVKSKPAEALNAYESVLHLAFFSLAGAHFFRRDFEAFRSATERAVTLNPRDSSSAEGDI